MKILICSDGSEQAEQAMRVGAVIAAGCHAEVTLLGIIEAAGKSASILESLQRQQAMLAGKKISAELITKAGEPIREIVKRTEEARYDLVVIGATHKKSSGLFWMSAKVYAIIKEIEPPVLSVAGKACALERILICSGGKTYIDAAVKLTGEIARGAGASVALLHVMADAPVLYSMLYKGEADPERVLQSNSELGLNLRREKETLESLGVVAEVRLRRGGVLEEILRELRSGDFDLVVTGSAPSGDLRTYVLGDISREILNRVHCPVLVARSHQAEGPPLARFRKWFR